MGMTIWINIFDGKNCYSNQADHSAVFALTEQLDSIAINLGIKTLSAFYDYTEMKFNLIANDFQELEDEKGWSNNDANWFNPQEGLATINAILKHLEQDSQYIDFRESFWSLNDLIDELEDCKTELQKAMSQGFLFHFCILD